MGIIKTKGIIITIPPISTSIKHAITNNTPKITMYVNDDIFSIIVPSNSPIIQAFITKFIMLINSIIINGIANFIGAKPYRHTLSASTMVMKL